MVKERQGQDQVYTLNLFCNRAIFMLLSKLQYSIYEYTNVLRKSWLELTQHKKKCIYSVVMSLPND